MHIKRLQIINTSIDTFFCAFLAQQRRRRKANDGYKKLDGTMDQSSVNQEIRKSDATVHKL